MIKGCDIGIVMGRDPNGLKEIADYVTENSENDGAYYALQWLMHNETNEEGVNK